MNAAITSVFLRLWCAVRYWFTESQQISFYTVSTFLNVIITIRIDKNYTSLYSTVKLVSRLDATDLPTRLSKFVGRFAVRKHIS
jgi:hypothetical protein